VAGIAAISCQATRIFGPFHLAGINTPPGQEIIAYRFEPIKTPCGDPDQPKFLQCTRRKRNTRYANQGPFFGERHNLGDRVWTLLCHRRKSAGILCNLRAQRPHAGCSNCPTVARFPNCGYRRGHAAILILLRMISRRVLIVAGGHYLYHDMQKIGIVCGWNRPHGLIKNSPPL